jgi:hypothetical protein
MNNVPWDLYHFQKLPRRRAPQSATDSRRIISGQGRENSLQLSNISATPDLLDAPQRPWYALHYQYIIHTVFRITQYITRHIMFEQMVGCASVVCRFSWYKSGAGLLIGHTATPTRSCNMNAKVLVVAFCAFQVRTALSCSARLFALKPNYFSDSINGMFTAHSFVHVKLHRPTRKYQRTETVSHTHELC